MSTIPIDDKLIIGPDRANIDARYKASNNRPYTSVAAAETAINLVIGNVGLTVLVADENDPDYPKAKEYWVQPKGTTPETYGLVLKGSSDIDITTEQIEGGTRVIITDADGTQHSFDVKDGASYSTGYYYGQYASESELPQQTTVKGYAYVATQDPAVYYVYTISGENGTWENSGEKFVTTSLETNLASKSQTKAPTTKSVAEGIEAVDVTTEQEFTSTQKETARTNIGAQEDIASMDDVQPINAALNDREADVVPVTNEVKALGYKVLKAYDPNNPNTTTFQAQVTEPNTIYEIKSYFSLGERLSIAVSDTETSIGSKYETHKTAFKLYGGSTVTFDAGVVLNSARTEILGEGTYTNEDEDSSNYISYYLAVPYDKYLEDGNTYDYSVDGMPSTVRVSVEKELGVVGYFLSESIQVNAGETVSVITDSVIINQDGNTIVSDGIGNYTATSSIYIRFGHAEAGYNVKYVKCQLLTLPANTVLKFNGGKIDNGIIDLNDCKIDGTESCFSDGMKFLGKTASTLYADVWDDDEDADKIERCIRYFSSVNLHSRTYTITRPIVVSNNFTLLGKSQADFFGSNYGNTIDGKGCQLKAIGGIDCIIDVRGKYAPKDDVTHPVHGKVVPGDYASYVSARIDGVSFVSSRNTDAIWWSTPGGPSRPVIIENCTFASLINGIHVWGSTKTYSTNMGDILIQGCDFHGNVWGINAEGVHCVGGLNIASCLMEGNHNNDYTDGGGIKINGLFGTLRASSVELEGQPYGVNIIGSNMNVILENNYFEYNKGQKNIIKGNGVDRSRVYLSTTGVTHQEKVEWNIRSCLVEFAEGHGASFSNKYSFEKCLIATPLNGRVVEAKDLISPIQENIDFTTEDIIFKYATTPFGGVSPKHQINNIKNGYPIFINTAFGRTPIARQLNCTFHKGTEYIIAFYIYNTSSSNSFSSADLGLSSSFPVCKGRLCLYNYRFKPLETFPLYKTDEENGIGLSKNQTITVTAIEGVTVCLLKSMTDSDGYELIASNSIDTSTNLQYTASSATTLYIAVAITASDDEDRTISYQITEVQEQETVVVSTGSVTATDVVFRHSNSMGFSFTHNYGDLIISRPVIIENSGDKYTKLVGYPLDYAEMYGYKENITNVPVGYRWPEGDYCSYDGTKWIDQNGFTYAAKAGTSSERPTLVATDAGYPYFDTTINKTIYWNGSYWIDANGETVGLQVSDTSVLIGAAADSTKTISVYYSGSTAPTITVLNADDSANTWLTATLVDNTLTLIADPNATNPSWATNTYYSKSNNTYNSLGTQPDDWETKFFKYFTKEEVYTKVTGNTAPSFALNTYFSENNGEYTLLLSQPDNWPTNYTDYYTKQDVYHAVTGTANNKPRGAKVLVTLGDELVIINVVQTY